LDILFLAKSIKNYLRGKTILTIHYSQSLFDLNGNIPKLHEIIQSPVQEDDPSLYTFIRDEIKNVGQMIDLYVDKVISITHHSFMQNNEIYHITNNKNILIYNALHDVQEDNLKKTDELKKELGINCSEKIIIYAGRLDEIKGVQCLLQALSILKSKGEQFHLFIAGNGYFEATIDFVQNLYTNITFTGFLGKDRLYQLYSIADIGVFPSLYEEFGYVVLEMMMHRLPVVAYRTSGPAEIIEDGHTGLLAELYH
jgi:glycosyltransferase involved in cell wall biosynthesis